MMKNGILLLFSLLAIYKTAVCQEPADGVFPLNDGKIYYEQISVIDSTTKDEIFRRAKLWSVNDIHTQKSTIESEDKDSKYMIYKTTFSIPFELPEMYGTKMPLTFWNYDCVINFQIKNAKAKVSISGFELRGLDNTFTGNESTILNYRKMSDFGTKGPFSGKKLMAKFYSQVKNNFILADKEVLTILSSIGKALSTKPNSDF